MLLYFLVCLFSLFLLVVLLWYRSDHCWLMACLISAYLVLWLWWIEQQYTTHIGIYYTQRQSVQILEQTFGVTYCVCNGCRYWRVDSTHRLRLKVQVIDIRSCTFIVKLYQVWKNQMERWNSIIFNSLRTTFSNMSRSFWCLL